MVRRDGAEAKKERMQQIAKHIQALLQKESSVLLSKTIAVLEYEFGLTKERILAYLETLEKLGQFTIDKELDKIKKRIE